MPTTFHGYESVFLRFCIFSAHFSAVDQHSRSERYLLCLPNGTLDWFPHCLRCTFPTLQHTTLSEDNLNHFKQSKATMARSCCAVDCTNRREDGWRMFYAPRGSHPFAKHRRRLWIQTLKSADWGPKASEVCAAPTPYAKAAFFWSNMISSQHT